MEFGVIGAALEHEHHEIDAGIEAFEASREAGTPDPAHLRRAIDALRRHIYIEEEFLFPPMQQDLAIPTLVMLREHGEIWRAMDRIEQGIDVDPGGVDVVAACRELLARLTTHNAKEEPIFYTQADSSLSGEESQELIDFLESGELPAGWLCKNALDEDHGRL